MKKINVKNLDAIEKILNVVQKRAVVRTVMVSEIIDSVDTVSKKLGGWLYKKDWHGVRVHVDLNAQNFPGAYKGNPESTGFILRRGSNDWFISAVGRKTCASFGHQFVIDFTDDQKKKIAEFVSDSIRW